MTEIDFNNLFAQQWSDQRENEWKGPECIQDDTFRGIYRAMVYFLESEDPNSKIYAASSLKELIKIGGNLYRISNDPQILVGIEKLTEMIKKI